MTDKNSTWHEEENTAIEVEDTEVGREVSIYERVDGEWNRQHTLPAGDARNLRNVLDEAFPSENE